MTRSPLKAPRSRIAAAGIALTTLTAIAAIVAAFFGTQISSAEAPTEAPAATPVSVATVVRSDVSAWDEFSGRLEAVERVDVRSRVAGAVRSVHFREGALVKRGELLITIDPAPYAAEVEQAEAQVAAAQARVTHTHSELDRARRLLQESAIAQRDTTSESARNSRPMRACAPRRPRCNPRGSRSAIRRCARRWPAAWAGSR